MQGPAGPSRWWVAGAAPLGPAPTPEPPSLTLSGSPSDWPPGCHPLSPSAPTSLPSSHRHPCCRLRGPWSPPPSPGSSPSGLAPTPCSPWGLAGVGDDSGELSLGSRLPTSLLCARPAPLSPSEGDRATRSRSGPGPASLEPRLLGTWPGARHVARRKFLLPTPPRAPLRAHLPHLRPSARLRLDAGCLGHRGPCGLQLKVWPAG